MKKMDSCKYGSKKGCKKDKYTQWNSILKSKPTFSICPPRCIYYEKIEKGLLDKFL
jgi:hypothetical protein